METYYRFRPYAYGSLAAAVGVVLILWPWLTELLTGKPSFWVSLVAQTFITGILVLSLNLAMGYSGLFSIVHAGLLAFGGYAVGILSLKAGVNEWAALVGAIAATALFSLLIIAVSLRATYIYFGLITFAFNMLVLEIAREWDVLTGGYYGLVGIQRPSLLGRELSGYEFYYVCLIFLVLAYMVYRNVVKSRAGRSFQSVRESTETSMALGMRVGWARTLSWLITGALAGLAGALFAYQLRFMSPDVAVIDNLLILLVGLLLGGIRTLSGPLYGVVFYTVIDQAVKGYAEYRRILLGLVLLGAMMVIPAGVVGTWKKTRFGRDLGDRKDGGDGIDPAEVEVEAPDVAGDVPVISARGVTKSFGGLLALDNVDFEVSAGEIHGLIGPNGSGKSTLVGCVTSFLEVDSGSVEILGGPVPSRPHEVAKLGVIRVFQTPHVFGQLSLVDNVLAGMHMKSRQTWLEAALRLPTFQREEDQLRRRAQELLVLVGLADQAHLPAGSVSHGQKRLLEIARALAAGPLVLILDEPTTGLTSEEIREVDRLLRRLREVGLTIALIEHNMNFVMSVCDRLTVLDGGRLIECGSPEVCRRSKAVREAYLGGADLLERIIHQEEEAAAGGVGDEC